MNKSQKNRNCVLHVIIPTRDSPHLESTLKSIVQSLNNTFALRLNVLIVSSSCSKKYIEANSKLPAKYSSENVNVAHIVEDLPGKSRAINKGVQSLSLPRNTPVCIICDDVRLSRGALGFIQNLFWSEKDSYTVSFYSIPEYPEEHRFLTEVMKMHQQLFYFYENKYVTGRMMVYFPALIGELPEDIVSEDMYIEYRSRALGIKMIFSDEKNGIFYKKPSTLSDYLNQIRRFDFSFRQFNNRYNPQKISKSSSSKFIEVISGGKTNNMLTAISGLLSKSEFHLSSKIALLAIAVYQTFILSILFRITSYNTGDFRREQSTLSSG